MLSGTLGVNLSVNTLAGKGINRAGYGNKGGGITRAGYKSSHKKKNFQCHHIL